MNTTTLKKSLIEFVAKTEFQGKDLEEQICYYTTKDGFFVPNSLSFKREEAEKFYKKFLELEGNMIKTQVLDSAYLNTETII